MTGRIDSQDLTISNVFKDFYQVPDFQREYVWGVDQVERLLLDVHDEFFAEDGRLLDRPEYFIGSIVVCPGTDGTFQLIDGQQRLTTAYLVLCVIRDCLRAAGEPPTGALLDMIRADAMDPRTGADIPRYRLTLQYEDSDGVLEKIASAGTPVAAIPRSTASVRSILTAYETIRTFLSEHFRAEPGPIRAYMAAFTHRVKLIRIITPDLNRALKVFETINDRGVGLNAMDLLKNLLFMKTPQHQYPRLKDIWKRLVDTLDRCGEKPLRFLRYYVLSHHPEQIDPKLGLSEGDAYQWFVDHGDISGINVDPIGFINRLVGLAEAYAYFVAGRDAQGNPNRYLRNIAHLSGAARQHFILLLAGQHMAPELFSTLCRHVENLVFCYILTREQSKTYERNFTRWSKDLRTVTDALGLAAFVASAIQPELQARSRSFTFQFGDLRQNAIQQYRLRYILAKLTQFVEEQAWGNPAHAELEQYLAGTVDIEHILPRTPTAEVRAAFDKPGEYEDYVGRIGNLTLLEKTINTAVSNGTYDAKKSGYRQSSFLLTRSLVEKPQVGSNTQLNRAVADLVQFDQWISTAVEQRTRMLAGLARKVWQVPDPAGE